MAYVVIERHMCNSATCYKLFVCYENIMACNKNRRMDSQKREKLRIHNMLCGYMARLLVSYFLDVRSELILKFIILEQSVMKLQYYLIMQQNVMVSW